MSDTQNNKSEQRASGNPVTTYLREVRGEVRKVTWPTRPEAIRLTGIVLAATAVMTLILYSFDYLFSSILTWSLDVIPGLF